MHVLDSWDFGGKGFDLETPKKYTFALVEVKWVFNYRDFSKIAVLFLCILIFATKNDRFWMFFEEESL